MKGLILLGKASIAHKAWCTHASYSEYMQSNRPSHLSISSQGRQVRALGKLIKWQSTLVLPKQFLGSCTWARPSWKLVKISDHQSWPDRRTLCTLSPVWHMWWTVGQILWLLNLVRDESCLFFLKGQTFIFGTFNKHHLEHRGHFPSAHFHTNAQKSCAVTLKANSFY